MFSENEVNISEFTQNNGRVLVLTARKGINPVAWLKSNKQAFERSLLNFGGILLRDFSIDSVSEFYYVAQTICPKLLDYTYRSTPRTKLGKKIYTATEYPSNRSIPLHNECSYTLNWPSKILFFCVIEPDENGETPVADSREVLKGMPLNIVDNFESKKILYVRNYTKGIDLPWEEVFQTNKKEEVEFFCQTHKIQYSWREESPQLTTQQVAQATLVHPITQEKVWFNQAHLFHNSCLSDEVTTHLSEYLSPDNFPRNAFYGDFSQIDKVTLESITNAYEKETILFKWKQGDILILDNILMAHGRRPYKGDRKIVVAMG